MTRNQVIIVTLLLVGIVALAISSMLEYREESTLDWKKKYTLDSKDPYGAWMFDQMVKTYFDSNNVAYNYRDTLLGDMDTTDVLYIMFGSRFTYQEDEVNEIFDFVDKGNNALVIGRATWLEDTTYYMPSSYGSYYKDSILNFKFEYDTSATLYTYKHFEKSMTEKARLNFRTFDYSTEEGNYTLGVVNDTLAVYTRTAI